MVSLVVYSQNGFCSHCWFDRMPASYDHIPHPNFQAVASFFPSPPRMDRDEEATPLTYPEGFRFTLFPFAA